MNQEHKINKQGDWVDDLNKWDKKREREKANPLKGRKFLFELFYYSVVFFLIGAFLGICITFLIHPLLGIKIYFGVAYFIIFLGAMMLIAKGSQDRYQKLWFWSSVNAFIILMLLFGRFI